MLTDKQISEFREHLDKSQNPLFFFDNDTDGLCSFLLLRRAIGRGKGVAIRSFPELNVSYSRKIQELNPDAVFILDKPLVSPEFLQTAKEKNIPVIWLDHHDVPYQEREGVYYFNPLRPSEDAKDAKKSAEPTTYWAYAVAKRKEDSWIALLGCIADGFLPEFSEDVAFKYPRLWKKTETAFQGVYETQLGRISRVFSFALKDRTSNVINMMRFLSTIKDPEEILIESMHNTALFRYHQINKKYQVLLAKAKKTPLEGNILYFQYGGDLSLSADIANELFYKFPDRTIIVAYIRGSKANLSIRSNNEILKQTLQALQSVPGATGGGHKHSVGASMPAEDLLKFKEELKKLLS